MNQKHFMDIERVKLGDELTTSNTGCFEVGDIVQITEKFDGSNASIRYDAETGKLVAFSRKRELDYINTLNGFWNFVQLLNPEEYKDVPNYVIFGEWAVKNAIKYKPDSYGKWYVYDIYDVEKQIYLPQATVKEFAAKHNLIYISTFCMRESLFLGSIVKHFVTVPHMVTFRRV